MTPALSNHFFSTPVFCPRSDYRGSFLAKKRMNLGQCTAFLPKKRAYLPKKRVFLPEKRPFQGQETDEAWARNAHGMPVRSQLLLYSY